MSSPIISSSVGLRLLVTASLSSTLDSRNVTGIVQVSIFHSKTGKIWQELQDMPQLPLTKARSSRDVMILNASATSCSTYWRVIFHGRDSLAEAKMKNTPPSRRRRSRFLLKTWPKVIRSSLKSSWYTVDLSSSNKHPIMSISWNSSMAAWDVTILIPQYSIILGSRTGWQRTRKLWRAVCWVSLRRSRRNNKRMNQKVSNMLKEVLQEISEEDSD